MSTADHMIESPSNGTLSDLKMSVATGGKINPSDRATLLSGHKRPRPPPLAGRIDVKSSGEIGNIYLGIRCKPGVSFMNFFALPFGTFVEFTINNSFMALE